MKRIEHTILVHKELGESIALRSMVHILEQSVANLEGDVVLDFRGVRFVSRSFMDELYNSKSLHDDRVHYINCSSDLMDLWNAVKQTQGKKSKRVESHVEIKNLDTIEDVMNDLSGFAYTL